MDGVTVATFALPIDKSNAILDEDGGQVKAGKDAAGSARLALLANVLAVVGFFSAAAVDCACEVKAGCGKQQIVRQHPKPLADVQSCEKSRKSGCEVEIGEAIVKQPGQPDLARQNRRCPL